MVKFNCNAFKENRFVDFLISLQSKEINHSKRDSTFYLNLLIWIKFASIIDIHMLYIPPKKIQNAISSSLVYPQIFWDPFNYPSLSISEKFKQKGIWTILSFFPMPVKTQGDTALLDVIRPWAYPIGSMLVDPRWSVRPSFNISQTPY